MTKKPSHIPLFPDAYHRDTTHLTTEEHGAYFLLMMAAWGSDDCTLLNDERRLAALAKLPVTKWRKIAPTVLEMWTIDKGRIFQKRLLKEWHWVQEKSAKARASRAQRKDQSNDKRATNVATNVVTDGLHLGGGGGGGGGVLSQDRDRGTTLSENPFGVVKGGKP